jgi:hypothetical protein
MEAPPDVPRLTLEGQKGDDVEGLNRSHMSKRSATGAQLAHALSASHCLLTDWRPTA